MIWMGGESRLSARIQRRRGGMPVMGGLTKNGRHLEWVCCQQSGGVKGNKRKRVVENRAWRNREGGREREGERGY